MKPSTRSLVAALGWNAIALINLQFLTDHIADAEWGWAIIQTVGLIGSVIATVVDLNQWLARKTLGGVTVYIHEEDTHADH